MSASLSRILDVSPEWPLSYTKQKSSESKYKVFLTISMFILLQAISDLKIDTTSTSQ